MNDAGPRILIPGANFAGLTTARYGAETVGDRSRMTVIDRKPRLTFIPNIPLEVWNDNNPEVSLHLSTTRFFEKDGSDFTRGDVRGTDEAEIVADRSPV